MAFATIATRVLAFGPGTVGGDGDPVDAVILGPRRRAGEHVRLPVRAAVRFVDEGREDTKLVLSAEALSAVDRAGLVLFFTVYARAKRLLARLRGRSGEIAFRGLVIADAVEQAIKPDEAPR